jgi:Gas vesicle synthesis protein GvpL/GvpF
MTNDSGLYIYCVMDQKEEVGIEREKIQTSNQSHFKFGNIGVRNQPIFKISHKDLTAVVSNFSLKQLKADIDDVVAHQKVVETMRKEFGTTILPVRFGTILKNQQEVTILLSRSYNEYKSKLLKFSGKDEFGIKILITDAAKEKLKDLAESESEQIKKIKDNISSLSNVKPGSDYLLKLSLNDAIKNEISKKREQLALEIHQQFAQISVETTLLKADIEQIILNAAYLVDKNSSMNFESKLTELKKEYGSTGLVFHISGPWAPYSFC